MKKQSLLKVGGFVPLTTTDFPGELAAVIFCQGCPWQCRYCHNPHLIANSRKGNLDWDVVYRLLEKRRGLLDGVVFSGGEPTMQAEIISGVTAVKELGFKVGMHTAGQYPARLEKLIPLLDWVGMDIKAPFGKYEKITRKPEDRTKQEESIRLLVKSPIAHEFRTTCHPALLSEDDLLQIGEDLLSLGGQNFVLQMFRKDGCEDQDLCSQNLTDYFPSQAVREKLSQNFENFLIRNIQ